MRKLASWSVMILTLSLSACGGSDGESGDEVAAPESDAARGAPRCGTIAGLLCGRGQYCDTGTGSCGIADAGGVCRFIPRWCPATASPVCGCDGETYTNACAAAMASAVVDHAGACAPKPVACGGITGATCPAGQYCELAAGACHVADAAGSCRTLPQGCTADYDPVCGCDGKTYSNACGAAVAGINVDHTGACAPVAGSCGGTTGLSCASGEYCAYAEGQCGSSTVAGKCTKRAEICLQYMDPVCGCDGRTYYNGCAASAAGVNVAYHAECR